MQLPFLDREEEAARLRRLLARREGSLGVLYGRRRCGKSRLLGEVLPREGSVYYVGDERESALQRSSLATEIGRLVPDFERVTYPEWDALLARWWSQARPGSVLAIDELPALVSAAPELPSLLQKHLDREAGRGIHLWVAGSSQRRMQGLVLDRTAPLYGRASEILKISPLDAGLIGEALGLDDAREAVEGFSVWGGIPRYWELAAEHSGLLRAVRELVLSPLGVLYEEPARLLLDDLRDTAQAASILSLIGQGCHRASEIGGRLGKPATALSRPLRRLLEMELIVRETPFGAPRRGSKRTFYRIADPFLRFWFRFVEPNRSRLEARRIDAVEAAVAARLAHHAGEVFEELARASVPRLEIGGRSWGAARRWWGPGLDRKPMEVDLIAESVDGGALLVGEVKWTGSRNPARLREELAAKAARLPFVGKREVVKALWLKDRPEEREVDGVLTPGEVLGALR